LLQFLSLARRYLRMFIALRRVHVYGLRQRRAESWCKGLPKAREGNNETLPDVRRHTLFVCPRA
jgi:hypothetical protein